MSVPAPVTIDSGLIEIEDDDKVDLKRLASALSKLKLLHDIEPNPGPQYLVQGLPHRHQQLVEKY